MFINPKVAIEQGWVVSAEGQPLLDLDEKSPGYQIQQNGIDLRVDLIKQVMNGGIVGIDFKTKPEYFDIPMT